MWKLNLENVQNRRSFQADTADLLLKIFLDWLSNNIPSFIRRGSTLHPEIKADTGRFERRIRRRAILCSVWRPNVNWAPNPAHITALLLI